MPPQPRQQQTPPVPGLSEEGKRFLADLGLDLTGGGSSPGAVDKNTPVVYYGPGKPKSVYRTKKIDGQDELVHSGRSSGGGDRTKTLDEANDDFYRMTPAQLRDFQDRILAAGIVDAGSIRMGDYDDTTFKVWANINSRAASFYRVDQKRTPSEVLDMITTANQAAGFGDAAVEVEPGAVTQITPGETLAQQVQQAARARLGRRLRDSEVQRFVSLYQELERNANSKVVDARRHAQDGVSSEVVAGPSMDAAAADYVDDNFATEAAGQDTFGYYEALRQLVGGA
jgi:hypothetical protein